MVLIKNKLELASLIVNKAKSRNKILTIAESCTGGLIASQITSVPGASKVFTCGFITYSNGSKVKLLGVAQKLITLHGAVSREVGLEMAKGSLIKANADIALSVTGIAGPSGASAEKPLGLVYLALAMLNGESCVERQVFAGDRNQIREGAVIAGLSLILKHLNWKTLK